MALKSEVMLSLCSVAKNKTKLLYFWSFLSSKCGAGVASLADPGCVDAKGSRGQDNGDRFPQRASYTCGAAGTTTVCVSVCVYLCIFCVVPLPL